MKIFKGLLRKFLSSPLVRDESGVALVALVFVLGSAALVGTTAVLRNEISIQAELRVQQGQKAKFEKVQNAIEVFALRDFDTPTGTAGSGGALYRLPCPAGATAGNGQATDWNGDDECAMNRGVVPWSTVGLSEQDVIDERGNYLTYIVHTEPMQACNGVNPRTGSLDDLNSATNYFYSLISHGVNGFGGFNSMTLTENAAPSSDEEIDNCQNTACASGATANEYRSGPTSDDLANYFDDIVRSVELSENFTENCMDLFSPPDDETAFTFAMSVGQVERNVTRTSNDDPNFTARVQTATDDGGTAEDETDDTIVLSFNGSDGSIPTSACAWFEPPVPIQGHSVRILTEFAAEKDDAVDGKGNGVVFAFMSYDPDADVADPDPDLEDGSGYVLSDLICGGTDWSMGYADEQNASVMPTDRDIDLPDVPRVGVEIDTEAHGDSFAGEPDTDGTDNANQDPTTNPNGNAWNHIAIIGANNDHEGNDQSDTGDEDDETIKGDGPVCINDLAGSHGTGNHLYDTGEGNLAALQGCFPGDNTTEDGDEVGIFEVGEDDTPADDDYHQLRIDLIYGGGTCGVNEVNVSYWLFLNPDGATVPDCASATQDYADLTQNYTTGNGEDAAKTDICIPWTGDFNDEFMRFGFTSGRGAGGQATRDDLRVRRFDFRTIATVAAPAGTTADSDDQTREVHNVNVVDEVAAIVYPNVVSTNVLDTMMGLIDMNPRTLVPNDFTGSQGDETGIRLVGRNGVFNVRLNNTDATPDPLSDNEGIGLRGVGDEDTNEFDMHWLLVDSTPDPDESVYLNEDTPEGREAIDIRFYSDDDSSTSVTTAYERVSINLGQFGERDVTQVGEPNRDEEMRYRAFLGGSLVQEGVINSCNVDTGNDPDRSMFLSLDFSGNLIDQIILVPDFIEPSPDLTQYPEDEYGSTFFIRGIKACGSNRACGLTAHNDCVQYNGSYPYGGLGDPTTVFTDEGSTGVSGLITIDNIQAHFNALYSADLISVNNSSRTIWQTLVGHFEFGNNDDGPVFVDIIADPLNIEVTGGTARALRIEEDGDVQDEGFGVEENVNSGNGGPDDISLDDSEAIEFRFHNTWQDILLSAGRFGMASNQLEQMTVEGFLNGSSVSSDTVQSCETNNGTNNSAASNLIIEFPSAIDTIRLTPLVRDGGTASSTFRVHGIRACIDAVCGQVDFGTIQGDATCTGTHVMP